MGGWLVLKVLQQIANSLESLEDHGLPRFQKIMDLTLEE